MTQPLSVITPAAPPRRRSIWAIIALVGALVATGAAAPAFAEVVGEGPGTITGTVTSTDGSPVGGAAIWVTGPSSWPSTTTDASGYFELSGLELGLFEVSLSAEGYATALPQGLTLSEEAPTAALSFLLEPFVVGAGSISGLVTVDGVPLAGESLSAYEGRTGQNFYTVSDENGYYQFSGLANGSWNIYAFSPLYQPLNTDLAVITDSSPTAVVNVPYLSWPVGTSSIHGVVVDSETGEPITAANVGIYGVDVAHNGNSDTDGSGEFAFDQLPAGTYSLSLWVPGYIGSSSEVQIVDGEARILEIALVPTNASVSGHVESTDGTPVVGLYVEASNGGGLAWGWSQTDENGDYTISELGAVAFTIHVGGISTPFDRQERVITPVANANTVVNFTLVPRTTGYLTGMVFGPTGDFYSQPVCATLYSSKNKKPLASAATYGENFGDGTYSFADLKPGKYTVEFRDCDDDDTTTFAKVFLGGAKNFKDATFVTITAGLDSYENNVTVTPRSN